MRKALMFVAAAMLAIPAFVTADDSVNEAKTSTDTSTNPLTGSKTTTRKYKRKAKNADGSEANLERTDKTKVKKDGSVEHKTDVDADAESN